MRASSSVPDHLIGDILAHAVEIIAKKMVDGTIDVVRNGGGFGAAEGGVEADYYYLIQVIINMNPLILLL